MAVANGKPTKSWFKRALFVLLKIVAVLFSIVVVAVLLLMWACTPPSDKSLTKRFNRHREDFEELVRMSQEDAKVIRITDDFTRLKDNWAWPRPEAEWGISRERWNQYRKLFRQLGLVAGFEKDGAGNVYFIADTQGLAVSGSSKGFVYCGGETGSYDPGEMFLPCSEKHQTGRFEYSPGKGSSYRRLGENWYIFEDWN